MVFRRNIKDINWPLYYVEFYLKGFFIIVYNETIIIKCYIFSLNFPIGFKGVLVAYPYIFLHFFSRSFWKIDIYGSQERIRSRESVTNINLILISSLCHLCNLRLNDIFWLVYGFHNPILLMSQSCIYTWEKWIKI
jgi:hypothetical protein